MRKLLRVTPADGWPLAQAYWYLLRAGWKLFVRRERMDRWIIPAARAGDVAATPSEGELRYLSRRAHWVNAAARRPFPWARCLQRSLALCLWLERVGFTPEIRIGVQRGGTELKAHAWVEYYGHVINDIPWVKERFATLQGGSAHLHRMGW